MDSDIRTDDKMENAVKHNLTPGQKLSSYVDERGPDEKSASLLNTEHLPRGASPDLYLGQRLLPELDDSAPKFSADSRKDRNRTRQGYSEQFSNFLLHINGVGHNDGHCDRLVLDNEMVNSLSGQQVDNSVEEFSTLASDGVNSTFLCDKESAITGSIAKQSSTDDENISNRISGLVDSIHSLSISNDDNSNCHLSITQSQKIEHCLCSVDPSTVFTQSTNDVVIKDSSISSEPTSFPTASSTACSSISCSASLASSCNHCVIPSCHSSDPLVNASSPFSRKVEDFSYRSKTECIIPNFAVEDNCRTARTPLGDVQLDFSCETDHRDIKFFVTSEKRHSPNLFSNGNNHTVTSSFSDYSDVSNKPFFDPTRIFAKAADLRSTAVYGEGESEVIEEPDHPLTSSKPPDRDRLIKDKDFIPRFRDSSFLNSTEVTGDKEVHHVREANQVVDENLDNTKSDPKRTHVASEKRQSDRSSQKSSRRQNKTTVDNGSYKKARGKSAATASTEPSNDDMSPLNSDAGPSLPTPTDRPSVGRHDRPSGGLPPVDRPKGRSRFQWSSQKSGSRKPTSNPREGYEESAIRSNQGRLNFYVKLWSFFGRFCRDGFVIVRNVLLLVLGLLLITLEWLIVRILRAASSGYSIVTGWIRRALGRPPLVESEPAEEPFDLAAQWRTMSQKDTLPENIALPETGEEAMKRLFAGHGKDPYSILGLRVDCTDEQIRKYYRKQAVLVHPDKNREPGAEEAFKILNQAFDMIGEPKKKKVPTATLR